jgi:hypothetical protein
VVEVNKQEKIINGITINEFLFHSKLLRLRLCLLLLLLLLLL